VVDTRPFRQRQRQQMNLSNRIKLYSYCLTATSFHLLLKQIEAKALTSLMQRVCTTYVIYFNKKYHRIGTLFQGIYKVRHLRETQEILDVSKQIHLLPVQVKRLGPFSTISGSIAEYPYSSYLNYKSEASLAWIDRDTLLKLFKDSIYSSTYSSYTRFIEVMT
jgi:putative transposase